MTKSLVTGGAGFIGSNLVDYLLDKGHEVVCVDNERANNEKFYWNEKAYNVNCDILDHKTLKNCMWGIDYVFHLAAESRLQPAIENPIETVQINSVGTCNVLQCARETEVKRVVYSSTSSAYGLNEAPNVECQPDDCLNPYSISKVNGEKLCKMYTDLYGLETIVFRYFNVYGDRQPSKGQYAPVIGIFLRQFDNDQELTIVGDGEQRRDFINVKDVCKANYLAATKELNKDQLGQVYNVGYGSNYSVNEIAKMISDFTINIGDRPGEAKETLAHISKIKGALGWEPTIKVEDWINQKLTEFTLPKNDNPIKNSLDKVKNWIYGE